MPADQITRGRIKATLDAQSRDPRGVAPRKLIQHEKAEQRALWQWVQHQPWRDDFYHWPNERRSGHEAIQLQREGVKRGPSDNWLFLPVGGYVGAVSELKRVGATRSALKAEQREFLLRREAQGWAVGVHRGWLEAMAFFQDYVAGREIEQQEWWR